MPINTLRKSRLWNVLFRLVNSDWATVLLEAWKLVKSIQAERVVGLYEVLNFEHTLELCDRRGQKAIFHKRATVRLLQDYVSAYMDWAWGRGEIFADYRCHPGTAVDRYRCGSKHCVLISLREEKRRGEVFDIRIDRTVRGGFDLEKGWSETMVRHRTHQFCLAVIFPRTRPPKRVDLIEVNQNRTTRLAGSHTNILPDGRHRVSWQTSKPKLFETYTLTWIW